MDKWVIIHSGTKGMRKGVRQYQNEDGTWTELGKARRREAYGDTGRSNMMGATPVDDKPKSGGVKLTLKERVKAKKAAKAQQKLEKDKLDKQKVEQKKEEKSKSEEEEWAEEKRRIIESGNLELLEKNKGRMSNEEINKALERINTLQRVSDLSKKQADLNKGKDFVTKWTDRGEKLTKFLITMSNISAAYKKLNGDSEPKEHKLYSSLDELYAHRGEMTAKEFNEMYKAVASADSIKKKQGGDKGQQGKDGDKGQQGKDGDKGQQGKDGDKGQQPQQGQNQGKGKQGKKGDKGQQGQQRQQPQEPRDRYKAENDDRRWTGWIKKTDSSGRVKKDSNSTYKPDKDSTRNDSKDNRGDYMSEDERRYVRENGRIPDSFAQRASFRLPQQRKWFSGKGNRTRKKDNNRGGSKSDYYGGNKT